MYTIENELGKRIYLAGECVPSGTYKQIGGWRVISLKRSDYLPASLDGQVASYVREVSIVNCDAEIDKRTL